MTLGVVPRPAGGTAAQVSPLGHPESHGLMSERSAHGERLAEGLVALEHGQGAAALACFEAVLRVEPTNGLARVGVHRAYRQMVSRWHFAMLNDRERNHAFQVAISRTVAPDTLVLDIGSGSGLLAMIAARAGAQRVISCEMVRPVAEVARRIIRENGFSDTITVLDKRSQDLVIGQDMPRCADVLVTEIVDCGLLGEGLIPTIAHARKHLLHPAATIIPQAARVYGVLVESPRISGLNQASVACGLDVRSFNQFATRGYFPVRLHTYEHRFLSDPIEVFAFDFTGDPILPAAQELRIKVTQGGTCHAVAFWFELDVTESITLANQPMNTASHWMQAVQCLETELDVCRGQMVRCGAAHDGATIWFTCPTD